MIRRPPRSTLFPYTTLFRSTSPSDAEILIDGDSVGAGSAFDLPVAVGERRLEVRARGYKSFDTTLVVTAGSTVTLSPITLPPGGRGPGSGPPLAWRWRWQRRPRR